MLQDGEFSARCSGHHLFFYGIADFRRQVLCQSEDVEKRYNSVVNCAYLLHDFMVDFDPGLGRNDTFTLLHVSII